MTIPITEIFLSVEGEGIRAGKLCTFIRVAGCNLRCSFCDTTYSYEGGVQQTVEQILDQVKQLECPLITVTGGEPLLQKEVVNELIPQLLKLKYNVNIETNGSIDIETIDYRFDPNLMFTVDWKSPSSGMSDKMNSNNLKATHIKDVLKFVVGSQEDLEAMLSVINDNNIKAQIFVSPVFGKIQMSDIVKFMQDNKLNNVRLQCQLHKIIWEPEKRGV